MKGLRTVKASKTSHRAPTKRKCMRRQKRNALKNAQRRWKCCRRWTSPIRRKYKSCHSCIWRRKSIRCSSIKCRWISICRNVTRSQSAPTLTCRKISKFKWVDLLGDEWWLWVFFNAFHWTIFSIGCFRWWQWIARQRYCRNRRRDWRDQRSVSTFQILKKDVHEIEINLRFKVYSRPITHCTWKRWPHLRNQNW